MSTQNRKRPTNMKKTIHRFLTYLGNHKFLLIVVGFLILLSALANLFGTYMFKVIIDKYIPSNNNELYKAIIIEAIIYGIGVVSTFGYSQIMAYLAQKVVFEMRRDMFKKMEKLPIGYFDQRTHGEIMSNYINDIESVSDALNNAFAVLISNFVHIVGLLILIFIINWFLSIICLAFYVGMAIYIVYASKRSKKAYYSSSKVMANLNGYVEESITGQRVIKVFNHENENINKFDSYNKALRKSSMEALKYSASMVPIVVTISYINYAIVAIIGGFIALGYIPFISISLGGLTSYLLFVRQGAMPINHFTNQANILLNGLAGAERIFSIMDEKNEIDNGNVSLVEMNNEYYWKRNDELIRLMGDVRFKNVNFSYTPKKRVLSNLDLYAHPGQKIAFVGSTGAGKTTITNLINRFYEIENGEILIDGINVSNIRKDDLRKSLSIVLQDTHLFTGTILENIRYGNLNATKDDVIEAARLANADSFIKRLPNGYDTMIYSDGSNLSFGQRQLISIARAAISKRPILILDEATSSIDTRTEALVQDGMNKLMKNKTVFIIAHRLSTVKNADVIMVLEKGIIIERGSHKELIEKKGLYYRLSTGSLELE